MRYRATKTNEINPKLNSSEWEKANWEKIGVECWETPAKAPDTMFKILSGPEGLSVLLHTNEKDLRAETTEENGRVCNDSCMEFFFKPDPWNVNYFNFELNPKGVMHLGFGPGRHGRTLVEEREVFDIESVANEGDWTLKFYIPNSFLLKYVDKLNKVCKGNFYKCGELTGHSHYAMWSEVEVPEPDYHQPDFFGFIEL